MAWVAEIVEVNIVIAADNYDPNINELRKILANHPDPEDVDGHPVLAKQRPGEPARWIHVNLSTGDLKATVVVLAIRDDNIYLIGFKAQSGTWFEFGFKETSTRLIPGSTFLECGPDYKSLLGRSSSQEVRAKLVQLQLGKSVAEEAVLKLSGYAEPTPPGPPDDATKLGLARLIVMFCESSRMISICDTVRKGWASGTSISDRQVDYLWNWGNMSEALLAWKMGRQPSKQLMNRLRKIGIIDKACALAVVQLILNRPPKAADHEEEEDHGRPLVEVFAVRAGFPVTGTISVFDGICGQIIYKQQEHDQKEGEMVLTGPYRAISADGSFAIKVDEEGGMLTWNCYDDRANTMYDAPLNGAINTTHGPVEVTYAVLTNAVEATVQVRLLLAQAAAGALIHGKVTARSKAFDGVASVLFSHGSEHKVSVVAANESMIPLNRSVISVPLDAPLDVEASFVCTLSDADHGLEATIQGNSDFYPELSGDCVKRQFTEHGGIEVKVTWSDI